MQAMQSLFVSLDDPSNHFNTGVLNNQFVEIINIGVNNVLNEQMISEGHYIAILDAINDITQTCDFENLKIDLYKLCE